MRKGMFGGRFLLLTLAGALCAPHASRAQSYSAGPGLVLSLPDDAYDGTLASMVSSAVTVPCDGTNIVTGVTVTVAIKHTWIGDLVVKLVSPTGTVATLFSRPGFPEGADDGTGGFGFTADLTTAFPITFDDDAPVSSETMGEGIGGSGLIGDPSIESPDTYHTSGFLADHNLGAFFGERTGGDWTLYVGDASSGDFGLLDAWTLNLTTVEVQPGDSTDDGQVDLADLAALADCLSGPNASPNPTAPATLAQCLAAFDHDCDDDIDAADVAAWQLLFNSSL